MGEAVEHDARVVREISDGAKTAAWEAENADLAGKRRVLASEADSAGGSPGSKGQAHPSDSGRPQPGTDIVHARPTSTARRLELDHGDVDAIVDYIKGGNESINRALRTGQINPIVHARIKALRTALAKLPDFRGTVFREADIPEEILARYRRGNLVTEESFTSARRRGGHFIEGRVKFKIKSKHAKNISAYSNKPHEKEVLFTDGTSFEVTRRRYNRVTGVTKISMREL
ncbi:ADP-ribosyltransferase [Nocardia sp. NPDC004750]